MLELKETIINNPGNHLVILKIPAGGVLKEINIDKKVSSDIQETLERIIGESNTKIK